jgi:tetratricopeptide (TPR) repeat protein
MIENFEPVAWAEELLPRARAADHPRLTSLYVMATHCWPLGRIEESQRYADEGQKLVMQGRYGVPRGLESWLGGVYTNTGVPGRSIEIFLELVARDDDPFGLTRSGLVFALLRNGSFEEAKTAARELIEVGDVMPNPWGQSFALLAFGMAWCDADPARARDALQRGLAMAHDSGIRYNESHLANVLGRLEAQHGDALAALEHFKLAIRNYHDSGNTTVIRVPLASLAACLDRLGSAEGAAVVAGFSFGSFTRAWLPEMATAIAHLREVLGEQRYDELTQKGETMTTAEMVAYAYDQIDQARTELEPRS